MNSTSERAARALDPARPIIARLDPARDPEDIAADLIEGWNAVETALRTMLGGSSLSGQPLIHELRQRQMLSLDQAHALIEFLAARDRVRRTDYHPTTADVVAAKDGFNRLEVGLIASGATVGAGSGRPGGAAYGAAAPVGGPPRSEFATAAPTDPNQTIVAGTVRSRARSPYAIASLAVVLVAAGLALWYFVGRGSPAEDSIAQGIQAFQQQKVEAARAYFEKAVREDPDNARPHIYLARIARNQGDFQTATRELQAAVRADTNSALAYRELGSLMLQAGNYDVARRFYIRAIQRSPSDRESMGYLGCTMIRLGRPQEGIGFLQRAGSGPWSACAQTAPGMPGQMPPVQPPA